MILGIGFPNPVDWTIDKISGFVGGAGTAGFELIVGGLVGWVVDAVVWVVGGVFDFFLDSADPNVQADWFITGTGPYATTAGIGAVLLLLFVFAGIIQGTLAGDIGGMLRRIAFDLPVSVIAMVGLVTVTQALISLTDQLSSHVLGNFESDISDFIAVVVTLEELAGTQQSTTFVVFVLGLVTVLAGLVLVSELVVRASLIYIVVALAPLVFATRLWPATKGATRKLLELLVALILSKLVIAVALAVAAAAAVGAGSGGEVTALPAPEVFAEDPGGSVTQAIGILLTAAAAFGVAAFSPLLIARLLPLTEAAVVAQGVRGGPLRAGHQGMMMANTMGMAGGRLNQIASGKGGAGGQGAIGAGAGSKPAALGAGTGGAAGSGGAGAAGAGAGAGAAGGPIGVAATAATSAVKAAKNAASKGATAATQTAEGASKSSGEGASDAQPPAGGGPGVERLAGSPAAAAEGRKPSGDTDSARHASSGPVSSPRPPTRRPPSAPGPGTGASGGR